MEKKIALWPVFTRGIVRENPVLRLILGICPALAVTTSAINGAGMGVATTLVLLGSVAAISLMRNVIPNRVRIPVFIITIAGFTTVIQFLVQAFAPALNNALGIFLPLIAVNCVIFARAEMFAAKNKLGPTLLDSLGMGIGFTIALLFLGSLRELLGAGTLFGITITANLVEPMIIMILPPGGFFIFGILVALANKLDKRPKSERSEGCSGCPSRVTCKNFEIAKEEIIAEGVKA